MVKPQPYDTRAFFPVLDALLIEFLHSLDEKSWHSPTIAGKWTVKDIAAHLLDGNLRGLSASRDRYFAPREENLSTYLHLVAYLNRLNSEWTLAAQRLSPAVITELLAMTGRLYSIHLSLLDLESEAVFGVAWAGEETSVNRMHLAREFTEKFLHQLQIRDALGDDTLLSHELFYPFMDTCMFGLPFAYADIPGLEGTVVEVAVKTPVGGIWQVVKEEGSWHLLRGAVHKPDTSVRLHPDTAWKLFSKGLKPELALPLVQVEGIEALAAPALNMVSFMA